MSNWPAKIRSELETGKRAQERGNEGMARVCARRAAGWAANAFLEEQGIHIRAKSSFQRLLYLKDSDLLPRETRESLERLTLSLEKDDTQGESYWPLDVDLLDEARQVIQALLPDSMI